MSGSEEKLIAFIKASFPSVWALELLLALKREQRIWSHAELVSQMRASDLVIESAVNALVAGGLASLEPDGVRYLPSTAEAEHRIEDVEKLYRARPDRVRRAIVSRLSSSASAFADAFKLREGPR